MLIYFIADTHFSEENIMHYENRPFKDIAEMDEELVSTFIHRLHGGVGRGDCH